MQLKPVSDMHLFLLESINSIKILRKSRSKCSNYKHYMQCVASLTVYILHHNKLISTNLRVITDKSTLK